MTHRGHPLRSSDRCVKHRSLLCVIALLFIAPTWSQDRPEHHRSVQYEVIDGILDAARSVERPALAAIMKEQQAAVVFADEEYQVLNALVRSIDQRSHGHILDAHAILDSLGTNIHAAGVPLVALYHYELALQLKMLDLYDLALRNVRVAANLTDGEGAVGLHVLALSLQGDILRRRGDYGEAVILYERALKIAEANASIAGICNALIGWGNTLYYQDQYTEARIYYQRAADLASEYGYKVTYGNAMFNLAGVISELYGADSALLVYRDGLMAAKRIGDLDLQAEIHNTIGLMLLDKGRLEQAEEEVRIAMRITGQTKKLRSQAQSLYFLATIRWEKQERDSAIATLERCIELAAKSGDAELILQSEKELAHMLAAEGKHEHAFARLERHVAIKDSIRTIENARNINKLRIGYETDKKERTLAMRTMELEKEKAIRQRRSTQRNFLLGLLALMMLSGVLLYRNMRQRQAMALKDKELSEQRIEQILRDQELRLVNAMLAGQEKERERIAKDLHDGLGSILSAIKLQFSSMESRVALLQQQQGLNYEKVLSMLDQAVSEVRRISHNMVHGALAQFGLVQALSDLRDSIHITGTLDVELSLFGLEERLPRDIEIMAYRVVQELISNALKHADPTEVSISLIRSEQQLGIMVTDNGKGWDTAERGDGMGLRNVKERVERMNGVLQIDSSAGRGTTVNVEVPLGTSGRKQR